MQDNDGDWNQIAVAEDSLAHTVKEVKVGHTYRFRIRAVNVHGPSEASEASDPVKMEEHEAEEECDHRPTVEHGGSFADRFEVLEELGKGRFGNVKKVREMSTGQILAAKFVKCIKLKDKEKVRRLKLRNFETQDCSLGFGGN